MLTDNKIELEDSGSHIILTTEQEAHNYAPYYARSVAGALEYDAQVCEMTIQDMLDRSE